MLSLSLYQRCHSAKVLLVGPPTLAVAAVVGDLWLAFICVSANPSSNALCTKACRCMVCPPWLSQLIEDLWLPFFCVSTNLSKGEPSVHLKVWEA